MGELRVGDHVETPGPLAFGQIAAIRGADVEVRFSLATSPDRFESRTFRGDEVVPAKIPIDCAVAVWDIDRWIPGRVAAHGERGATGLDTYIVDLPAGHRRSYESRELNVTCFDVTQDLAAQLGSMTLSSVSDAARRRKLVDALVGMRGTSFGMSGLLSSAVELLPHQVEVVARVSSDPIVRYLLSDEVGLGKTIEAAAIIRAFLDASRSATAVVVVPDALVPQWQQELESRFFTNDFSGRLRVVPRRWLAEDPVAPTLLVVDEVHTLVSRAGMETAYKGLRRLGRSAEGLVLLTATPVLSDLKATIRLLHLLDPANFRLGDTEAYLALEARRESVQNVLVALSGGDSAFEANEAVSAVREAIQGDAGALELAGELRNAASARRADLIHEARIGLRTYLSDRYRLYNRMLRTRRRDLREAGYFYRSGRVDLDWNFTASARESAVALEDWRYDALRALDGLPDGQDREAAIKRMAWRYCRVAEVLVNGSEAVQEVARSHARLVIAGRLPTFATDAALLRNVAQKAPAHGIAARSMADTIRQVLGGLTATRPRVTPKVVAFTSSTAIAKSIGTELREPGSPYFNRVVTEESSVTEARRVLQEFKDSDTAGVLVCDRAGEVGLNLQFATLILHLDLPLSVMRMEQRIGRLDRIGRTAKTFDHRVYLPANKRYRPWPQWLDLLTKGFRVFEESVADLQDITGQLEFAAQRRLFEEGAVDDAYIESVRDQIVREREQLDRRYLVERLEIGDSQTTRRLEAVVASDGNADQLEDQIRTSWELDGGLVFRAAPRERTFDVQRNQRARPVPAAVRAQLGPVYGSLHSFGRDDALRRPGVRVVRPGHPLVDALPELLRDSRRGAVTAVWRHAPAWADDHGEATLFRVGLIVEAAEVDAHDGRRRLADSILHPWFEDIVLDAQLRVVSDPELLAMATATSDQLSPRGIRDFDGRDHATAIHDRLGTQYLAELVMAALANAPHQLACSPGYQKRMEAARAAAIRRLQVARLRVERHASRGDLAGDATQATQRDLEAFRDLQRATEEAQPRVDHIQLIVLASNPPQTSLA